MAEKEDITRNIQVFARLRPIYRRERKLKSMGVIQVSGHKEVIVKYSLQPNITKKYSFDKAFGPRSKQVDIYQEVVSPLIEEVISGYNCTVLAYGQTGTGKTHTLVGENSNNEVSWQNDPMAGIIPRALSQLFDERRLTDSEYAVHFSYLELYNEELFDLLANSDDNNNSELRIYEDATRKGVNIVSELDVMALYSKSEALKIMDVVQKRRKMINAQSRRSHTVFTIVVRMEEISSEGEELIKVGRLNLVELAGSENISKAGGDNIDQSLQTLGRVITALVERHPHIPYGESKLTRLLQESLGGRTKTSIIATISPDPKDLEESLSTLEFAYRARNIQNKPEINQKMTKQAVLKKRSDEIDRLKGELQAMKENGGEVTKPLTSQPAADIEDIMSSPGPEPAAKGPVGSEISTQVLHNEKKDSISKIISVRAQSKQPIILDRMLIDSKIVHLYKCGDFYCSYTTSSACDFTSHLTEHRKERVLFSVGSTGETRCVYCSYEHGSIVALVCHVMEEHSHCTHACVYCLYTATAGSLVELHQKNTHHKSSPRVLKLNPVSNRGHGRSAKVMRPRKEAILPYLCKKCECPF